MTTRWRLCALIFCALSIAVLLRPTFCSARPTLIAGRVALTRPNFARSPRISWISSVSLSALGPWRCAGPSRNAWPSWILWLPTGVVIRVASRPDRSRRSWEWCGMLVSSPPSELTFLFVCSRRLTPQCPWRRRPARAPLRSGGVVLGF